MSMSQYIPIIAVAGFILYFTAGGLLMEFWFLPKFRAIWHKRHGHGMSAEEEFLVGANVFIGWPITAPYWGLVGLKRYAGWVDANPKQ